ncbi:cyclin-T1-3-like [Pistacia vera]|uniref:cyclin-T1-3-like n=1 Tax=Pistacia vera TaxID=55513 RepID=UPI001262B564|nr:cyclin-T1-3-like [Pistacia vera]XP_031269155.1 cyclin-T1-3-like [Pistacia vera]
MTEQLLEEPQFCMRKWYFSREEIEDFSPSRKDGISLEKESELRKLYCSFLQELGMKLKVPQVTIACAMMLCHRFFMRQSHAKNDWQTIAAVSTFLGCKIEETRCILGDVVVMSYEIMYKWDPSASQRIRQNREIYMKQKELVLRGERLLLATIAYDFDIQLPYKPLVTALKRLKLFPDLAKVAWNFVNDWLCTTLCLQYKPHYIAAGSMFLAAKFQKVKLPAQKGKCWWLEFDISPKQLEEVIRQMLKLLEQDRKQTLPPRHERFTQSTALAGKMNMNSSPQSCISDGSIARRQSSNIATLENDGLSKSLACVGKNVYVKEVLPSQTSDSASSSIIEDGEGDSHPRTVESDHDPGCKIISVHDSYTKIDASRIREALKRRRLDGAANKKFSEAINPEIDGEAWIERELENGIELESASSKRKRGEVL